MYHKLWYGWAPQNAPSEKQTQQPEKKTSVAESKHALIPHGKGVSRYTSPVQRKQTKHLLTVSGQTLPCHIRHPRRLVPSNVHWLGVFLTIHVTSTSKGAASTRPKDHRSTPRRSPRPAPASLARLTLSAAFFFCTTRANSMCMAPQGAMYPAGPAELTP